MIHDLAVFGKPVLTPLAAFVAILVVFAGCSRTEKIGSDVATDDVAETNQAIASVSAPIEAKIRWDHPSNLLENGSFEEGRAPWFSLSGPSRPHWMNFKLSKEQAHSGEASADFQLHSRLPIARGARIWGVVRDLDVESMPKRVSGWYRVDDWNRGAVNQYIQVVICAFDPEHEKFGGLPEGAPIQISFVLAGIESEPFEIANRKFIFAGPLDPTTGQWVRFDFDIHQAFIKHWGEVPREFGVLRVVFEARFDAVQPVDPVRGNVFFDDLYLGDG